MKTLSTPTVDISGIGYLEIPDCAPDLRTMHIALARTIEGDPVNVVPRRVRRDKRSATKAERNRDSKYYLAKLDSNLYLLTED